MKERKKLNAAALLRQKAEKCYNEKRTDTSMPYSESDTIKLLCELEVHQVELEMQNEELQAAKAKAEINAQKYTNLYDFAPTGYFTLDTDGRISELNLIGASMLGRTRSKLINSHFNLFTTPDTRPIFNDFFTRLFKTQTPQSCEVQLNKTEESALFIHLHGVVSDNGKKHLFLTAMDVSERVRAEAELRIAKEEAERNEKYYQNILNNIGDPVFVKDDQSRMLLVNDAFCRFFNLQKNDIIGKTLAEEVLPQEQEEFLKIDRQVISDGKENLNEESLTARGGKTKTIATRKTRFIDAQGKTFLIGVIRDISERKQSEDALRTINEFNTTLLHTIPFGMNIVDEKGNILFLSEKFEKLIGRQANGQKCWELYRDDKKQCSECPLISGITVGQTSVYESTGVLGGKTYEISHTGMMFQGKKAILEIFHDITNRKKTEQELALALKQMVASESLKRKMVSNIGDVIVIINNQENNKYKSPNVEKLFGWKPEEIIGNSFWDHVHPDDLDNVQYFYRGISSEPGKVGTTEYRYRHKDGHYSWIEFTGSNMLHDSDIKGMLGNYHDITERKKIKDALLESETKFREMAELLPQIVFESDTLGNLTYANKYAYSLTGYSEQDSLIGKSTLNFFIPEDRPRVLGNIKIILAGTKNVISDEYSLLHKDGSTFSVLIYSNLIVKENKPAGLRGIIVDISEIKKTQHKLIIAKEQAEESDRLKSAFLANISHEIRTPLNGILGFAELLKIQELSHETRREYIGIINKSGERLLNIINDIVNISKIEAGLMEVNMTKANINEQIEFIYTFFKPEVAAKGIRFTYSNPLPKQEAMLKTDREKLYAILTNLIKNAIKFTRKGSIDFGYVKKGDLIEFFVKDTGCGIPKNRQEAIFERFIQADITDKNAYQGAGLGLTISQAYANLLGGKIWVESKEGQGSIFYFTLPFRTETIKENRPEVPSPPPVEVSPIKNLKILVVEDDNTSAEFISIAVNKFVKEIIHVSTGIDAIAACKNAPDIDLVLMDIKMPGMDGYEATRQIRKFNKNTVIIAQTAHAMEGDKEKALMAGCNDYISKPIQTDELDLMIQKHMKK